VKLFLCLIKHHAMKTYGEVEVYFQAFLISALDGGEWLFNAPASLPSGKEPAVSIGQEVGWTPEPISMR